MRGLLWSATIASMLIGTGCNGSGLPAQPSPQPPAHTPFVPAPGSNGSLTWVSIIGSRPLCREITSQVGMTWSLWLTMDTDGDAVTLTLSHHSPLPPGPFDEPPDRFKGTRQGNAIVASRIPPMGGMACPGDVGITPQVGGDLTATVSGRQISGEYTEIFGTGPSQVTFVLGFQATLPE